MQIKKILASVGVGALVALSPVAMHRAGAATEAPAAESVAEAVSEDVAAEVSEAVEGVTEEVATEEGATEEGATEGEKKSGEGHSGKISHAAEECIHLLEKGEPIDNCQKAPNPILPPMSELLWGSAAFFIVLAGLWKFAIPALKKTMAARTAKIEGDLAAAAKAKTDAEAEAQTYRSQIGNATAERDQILADARAEAENVRRDLIARAEADAAEVRRKATEDSAAQSNRLKGELEAHVKRLSVDLAEKVVGANLNRDTNNALVDKYIAELGAK